MSPCVTAEPVVTQPLVVGLTPRTASIAARPAASPMTISCVSIRSDPHATCVADVATGTRRLRISARFGVRMRYGMA